jgi:hypothetical protein
VAPRAFIIPKVATRHDLMRLQTEIDRAPNYGTKVALAISRTIKSIHGLVHLHGGLKLEDIEIYIGKSADRPASVYTRWRAHSDRKHHRFGLILFKCTQNKAKVLEKVAIRLFHNLKERGRLCVGQANVAKHSPGRDALSDNCVIYMTWNILNQPCPFTKPTQLMVNEISETISAGMTEVSALQVRNGLKSIKRLSTREKISLEYFKS